MTGAISCGGNIGTVTCQVLVTDWLSAELGATVTKRKEAKACLDAMFGTADQSPCSDD